MPTNSIIPEHSNIPRELEISCNRKIRSISDVKYEQSFSFRKKRFICSSGRTTSSSCELFESSVVPFNETDLGRVWLQEEAAGSTTLVSRTPGSLWLGFNEGADPFLRNGRIGSCRVVVGVGVGLVVVERWINWGGGDRTACLDDLEEWLERREFGEGGDEARPKRLRHDTSGRSEFTTAS